MSTQLDNNKQYELSFQSCLNDSHITKYVDKQSNII